MKKKHLHSASFIDPDLLYSTALNAFFNISKLWQLETHQEQILLGLPKRSTFFKWKKDRQGQLSQDTLERISYIMGIYKALQILLPDEIMANAWIKKPNDATLFNGKSALEKMLGGNVADLSDVRRYLDVERGG